MLNQFSTGIGVNAMAFGPNGNLYTGATTFPEVAIYDPITGDLLNQLSTTIRGVNAMAFGPDGNLYVSAGDVEVLDPITGQSLNSFSTTRPTTDALAFAPVPLPPSPPQPSGSSAQVFWG